MDDPDATVPVPKPTPQDGGGMTDEAMGALFDAASPAFATQRTTPTREWQPPGVEELQQALPQYEISAFIARGGMGAVYKGTQRALKRTVAIKVLPPQIEDADMQYAERFKREAQAMAQLTHPNIVAVYDAGEVELGAQNEGRALGPPSAVPDARRLEDQPPYPDGGLGTTRPTLLYFVMEFIEGTDVHRLISSEKRLDPQRAMSITSAVCDALAFAHEEGIIHRDIKPSNIMLDKKGRVKVADFGLAKVVNLDSTLLTSSNMAMGTPDFIAPEALIAGMQVDQRADIYAVGVMLYQMLTGRIPRGRFALPSGVIPQIDPRLDAIVDKAMQTEREKRYSTAQEMKADVERLCRASVPEGRAAAPSAAANGPASTKSPNAALAGASALPKAKSRAPLLIAAAVLVIAAVAFIALKQSGTPKTDPGTVSSSPSLPVSASSLSPSTEPWVNALADKARLHIKDAEITPQGLRLLGKASMVGFVGGSTRDGAIRMLATHDPAKAAPALRARGAKNQSQIYRLAIFGRDKAVATRWDEGTKTAHPLGEFPLPTPLKAGEDYELELRAVGSKLTVKFNGKLLGEVEDSTIAEGSFGITRSDAAPVLVKALEHLNLGSGAVPARNASRSDAGGSPSPAYPPGKWVKVFTKEEELRAADPDLPWHDGWIDATAFPPGRVVRVPGAEGRNRGIRLHGKIVVGSSGLATNVQLRRTTGESTCYQFSIRGLDAKPSVAITYFVLTTTKGELRYVFTDPPLKPGDEFDMELIAIGGKLYGKFNGKPLPVATDTRLTEGEMGFQTRHMVRDVEVINLDGLSEAEALKAAGLADGSASNASRSDAGGSPSPSPQVSASAPTFPPGKWTKAITKFEDIPAIARNNGFLAWREGWIEGTSPKGSPVVLIPGIRGHNQGIRLHGKVVAGAAESLVCNIGVRRMSISTEGKACYRLTFTSAPTSVGLFYYDEGAVKNSGLPSKLSQTPLKPGDEFDLELIAIGDKLYGKFNGKPLPVVTDTRLTEGELGFQTRHMVRDIEVINLDGLSDAEALKAAGLAGAAPSPSPPVSPGGSAAKSLQFPHGRWVKVFAKEENIVSNVRGGAVTLRDGWIDGTGPNPGILVMPGSKGRNQGMRLHGKFKLPSKHTLGATISVRRTRDEAGVIRRYVAGVTSAGNADIAYSIETEATHERIANPQVGPAFATDAEYDLELIAIGDKLHTRFNGKALPVVTDTRLTEGELAVMTTHFIRDVEVIYLDGLSEAEALKAAGLGE